MCALLSQAVNDMEMCSLGIRLALAAMQSKSYLCLLITPTQYTQGTMVIPSMTDCKQ